MRHLVLEQGGENSVESQNKYSKYFEISQNSQTAYHKHQKETTDLFIHIERREKKLKHEATAGIICFKRDEEENDRRFLTGLFNIQETNGRSM